MASNIFLKIGGGPDVKGESKVEGHINEIEVLSWTWKMLFEDESDKPGKRKGRGSVKGITITKYLDASSPQLTRLLCGTHTKVPSVCELKMLKTGAGTSLGYVTIILKENITVSDYSTACSTSGATIETFVLGFSKFEFKYVPQGQTQEAKPDQTTGEIKIEQTSTASQRNQIPEKDRSPWTAHGGKIIVD